MRRWGRIVRLAAVLAAFLSLPGLGEAVEARNAPSLCSRGEKRLFSCGIGRKLVSVCSRSDGTATYRFGRPGHVQMRAGNLRFAQRAYSGGGEQQIWFENNGYRYVVYERLVRTAFGQDGRHDPQASAGLLVQQGGKTLSDRQCRGVIASGAASLIPRDVFVEH